MILWRSSPKPHEYASDYTTHSRCVIELNGPESWARLKEYGWLVNLSFGYENLDKQGQWYRCYDHYAAGIKWGFNFGHEMGYYDGEWHLFSLGSFYVNWYR